MRLKRKEEDQYFQILVEKHRENVDRYRSLQLDVLVDDALLPRPPNNTPRQEPSDEHWMFSMESFGEHWADSFLLNTQFSTWHAHFARLAGGSAAAGGCSSTSSPSMGATPIGEVELHDNQPQPKPIPRFQPANAGCRTPKPSSTVSQVAMKTPGSSSAREREREESGAVVQPPQSQHPSKSRPSAAVNARADDELHARVAAIESQAAIAPPALPAASTESTRLADPDVFAKLLAESKGAPPRRQTLIQPRTSNIQSSLLLMKLNYQDWLKDRRLDAKYPEPNQIQAQERQPDGHRSPFLPPIPTIPQGSKIVADERPNTTRAEMPLTSRASQHSARRLSKAAVRPATSRVMTSARTTPAGTCSARRDNPGSCSSRPDASISCATLGAPPAPEEQAGALHSQL